MVMMHQMMMMMPQCQRDDSSDEDEKTPQHAPGQRSAGSAEASDHQHPSPRRPGAYIKDESAVATKNATFVHNLPRTRISESLEALHETLDSTMTSELDLDGLLTCLDLHQGEAKSACL
jgi:hypothetical protein